MFRRKQVIRMAVEETAFYHIQSEREDEGEKERVKNRNKGRSDIYYPSCQRDNLVKNGHGVHFFSEREKGLDSFCKQYIYPWTSGPGLHGVRHPLGRH